MANEALTPILFLDGAPRRTKGDRVIPLFPAIAPALEVAWHEAPEDVIPFRHRYPGRDATCGPCFRRSFVSGAEPWPKLFQNLRSSRQTELEELYPSHVVCAWMGTARPV